MLKRNKPLARSIKPLRRTPIRRVSKKRGKQLRDYSKARKVFLLEHPICEVWLKENGWWWVSPGWYRRKDGDSDVNAQLLSNNYGAPAATEVHHMNKRRGEMLLDENFWLASSRENHERIENNKTWARENGFLRDF